MARKREFLTTNEVAEVLGVSPFTIRRYISLRKLKAVKLEGSYRVRQTHLEDFIAAREIETEEELAAQEAQEEKSASPRRTGVAAESQSPRAARAKSKPARGKKSRRATKRDRKEQ